MQRDPRTYLWDIREAAGLILDFTSGKSRTDFGQDRLLQSGVERQFMIVGEALNQLNKRFPDLAAQISDCPQIVAFRNYLIHEYHRVDPQIVWEAVTIDLPRLKHEVDVLMEQEPDPPRA